MISSLSVSSLSHQDKCHPASLVFYLHTYKGSLPPGSVNQNQEVPHRLVAPLNGRHGIPAAVVSTAFPTPILYIPESKATDGEGEAGSRGQRAEGGRTVLPLEPLHGFREFLRPSDRPVLEFLRYLWGLSIESISCFAQLSQSSFPSLATKEVLKDLD